MMKRTVAILVCLIAAWLMGPAAANSPSECLLGLRDSLVEGDFSGPLVCSESDASFILVGRTNGDRYSIYDYRYRYLPPNGNVRHGGQKIVVFHGATYIGQYSLSPPPYKSISVCGARVVVQSQDGKGRYFLDFSDHPPSEVFVDDEILDFYR